MGVTSNNPITKFFIEAGKGIAFRYTALGAPRYSYNVEPIQLAAIVNELERLRPVSGAIAEIGVARGMTTRFIAQHLIDSGETNQKIYAIDTYSSFTEDDVDHEVKVRGKSRNAITGFAYNDYQAWSRNFARYPFVVPIQADCSKFDYASIAPIKLAFLDVDLYMPTKAALPKIFDALVDGGAILVDDVADNKTYDGAYQAYMEFCREHGLPPDVIGSKCGIIRKDR